MNRAVLLLALNALTESAGTALTACGWNLCDCHIEMAASNTSGRHRYTDRQRGGGALRRGCSRNVRSRDKYRT